MPKPLIYDDAVYHQGAVAFLTKRLNPHNAGTHIGMYLAWIIQMRLESFQLRQTVAAAVEEVRNKQLTGREFLFAHCNGRLASEALNKEAQAFTDFYYVEQYLHDYDNVLVKKAASSYTVADSWANFERLTKVMDQRLSDYRGDNPSVRPAAAS